MTTLSKKFDFTRIFAEQYPAEWQWMATNTTFEFANSMRNAVSRYGSLTPNQMAAVRRCVESAKRRAEENANRAASAPVVDTDKLMAAFDHAKAKGLVRLKMRFEGFAISPAPTTGRNAGALYVKNGEDYLGKIAGGKFYASRDCQPDTQTAIVRVMADPAAEAVAYGKKMGKCSICAADLTNDVSIARGIGPICASKYGF